MSSRLYTMEERHIKMSGLNGDKDNILVVDDGKATLLDAFMAVTGGVSLNGDNALVDAVMHDGSAKVKTFGSNSVKRYGVEEWQQRKAQFREQGRNEPCVCNSGKKYKRCHGKVKNKIAS